jgi:hypothetical protein
MPRLSGMRFMTFTGSHEADLARPGAVPASGTPCYVLIAGFLFGSNGWTGQIRPVLIRSVGHTHKIATAFTLGGQTKRIGHRPVLF